MRSPPFVTPSRLGFVEEYTERALTFPTHKSNMGVGACIARPPADFDVILCGRGFSPKTGTLLSAFADISPNRGITRHYAKKYIACVGGDDSAPRCRGGSPCPPVNFDIILRNDTEVVPYGL